MRVNGSVSNWVRGVVVPVWVPVRHVRVQSSAARRDCEIVSRVGVTGFVSHWSTCGDRDDHV